MSRVVECDPVPGRSLGFPRTYKAGPTSLRVYLADLIRYRELLYLLVWRDIKIRYKQAVLGVVWVVLQPLVAMVIFAIVLGQFAGLASRTPQTPYPLVVFCGLILWSFFASAVTQCSVSLLAGAHLITRVYFPRLIIPLATTTTAAVDLGVSLALLLVVLPMIGVAPSSRLLLALPAVIGTFLLGAGVGAIVSGLAVRYRDVRYAVPFALQTWMFATPVVYPSDILPKTWSWALKLNPMAGLVEMFRSAVIGGSPDLRTDVLLPLGTSVGVFVVGATCFVAMERGFADRI